MRTRKSDFETYCAGPELARLSLKALLDPLVPARTPPELIAYMNTEAEFTTAARERAIQHVIDHGEADPYLVTEWKDNKGKVRRLLASE